jgi:hypothetical protein
MGVPFTLKVFFIRQEQTIIKSKIFSVAYCSLMQKKVLQKVCCQELWHLVTVHFFNMRSGKKSPIKRHVTEIDGANKKKYLLTVEANGGNGVGVLAKLEPVENRRFPTRVQPNHCTVVRARTKTFCQIHQALLAHICPHGTCLSSKSFYFELKITSL